MAYRPNKVNKLRRATLANLHRDANNQSARFCKACVSTLSTIALMANNRTRVSARWIAAEKVVAEAQGNHEWGIVEPLNFDLGDSVWEDAWYM